MIVVSAQVYEITYNRARKGPESLVGEGPRRRRGTLTTTRNGRAREIYYSFIENRAFGGGFRENYETEKLQSRVTGQNIYGQSVNNFLWPAARKEAAWNRRMAVPWGSALSVSAESMARGRKVSRRARAMLPRRPSHRLNPDPHAPKHHLPVEIEASPQLLPLVCP